MSNKTRLDVLLTERGLLDSRQKAQATIMSGIVFVNGQRVDKVGTAGQAISPPSRKSPYSAGKISFREIKDTSTEAKSSSSGISSWVRYRALVRSMHTTRASLRSFQSSCP